MSEHSINTLTVSGKKEDILKFMAQFKSGKGAQLHSKKYIENTIKYGYTKMEIEEIKEKMKEYETSENDYYLNNLVPIPRDILEATGNKNVKDWCLDNWGTIVDIVERDCSGKTMVENGDEMIFRYKFYTLFYPPLNFVRKIKVLYPNLNIRFKFCIESSILGYIYGENDILDMPEMEKDREE